MRRTSLAEGLAVFDALHADGGANIPPVALIPCPVDAAIAAGGDADADAEDARARVGGPPNRARDDGGANDGPQRAGLAADEIADLRRSRYVQRVLEALRRHSADAAVVVGGCVVGWGDACSFFVLLLLLLRLLCRSVRCPPQATKRRPSVMDVVYCIVLKVACVAPSSLERMDGCSVPPVPGLLNVVTKRIMHVCSHSLTCLLTYLLTYVRTHS